MEEDNNKEIIESKDDSIIKEEVINNKKNKNSSDKFVIGILLSVGSFVIGAFAMYLMVRTINGTGIKERNVIKENVTSTTLEEVSDLKTGISNVYESTVYIEVTGSRTSASGSGFIYKKDDENAYILTNYHVIKGGSKFVVTFTDGDTEEATLVTGDEYYDVAILKISNKNVTVVASLGDSSKLELGDTVFTVGSPFGKSYMGTITRGIISGVNRMITISGTGTNNSSLMEVIQTDASINSGNSGGAICNIKGQVVGITSSKLAGSGVEGMGFAIPINSILSIIDVVESGNKIERPYLGVELKEITNTFILQYYYGIKISDDVDFGAVISYVEDDTPAAKAGLKMGDVIIEVDGTKVENVSYFEYLLYKHSVGDTMKIKYYRDNKLEETTVKLTESVKSE